MQSTPLFRELAVTGLAAMEVRINHVLTKKGSVVFLGGGIFEILLSWGLLLRQTMSFSTAETREKGSTQSDASTSTKKEKIHIEYCLYTNLS